VLTTRRQQGQDEERAVAYIRVSGCQMPVEEKRQSGLTGGGVVVVLVVNRLERQVIVVVSRAVSGHNGYIKVKDYVCLRR